MDKEDSEMGGGGGAVDNCRFIQVSNKNSLEVIVRLEIATECT